MSSEPEHSTTIDCDLRQQKPPPDLTNYSESIVDANFRSYSKRISTSTTSKRPPPALASPQRLSLPPTPQQSKPQQYRQSPRSQNFQLPDSPQCWPLPDSPGLASDKDSVSSPVRSARASMHLGDIMGRSTDTSSLDPPQFTKNRTSRYSTGYLNKPPRVKGTLSPEPTAIVDEIPPVPPLPEEIFMSKHHHHGFAIANNYASLTERRSATVRKSMANLDLTQNATSFKEGKYPEFPSASLEDNVRGGPSNLASPRQSAIVSGKHLQDIYSEQASPKVTLPESRLESNIAQVNSHAPRQRPLSFKPLSARKSTGSFQQFSLPRETGPYPDAPSLNRNPFLDLSPKARGHPPGDTHMGNQNGNQNGESHGQAVPKSGNTSSVYFPSTSSSTSGQISMPLSANPYRQSYIGKTSTSEMRLADSDVPKPDFATRSRHRSSSTSTSTTRNPFFGPSASSERNQKSKDAAGSAPITRPRKNSTTAIASTSNWPTQIDSHTPSTLSTHNINSPVTSFLPVSTQSPHSPRSRKSSVTKNVNTSFSSPIRSQNSSIRHGENLPTTVRSRALSGGSLTNEAPVKMSIPPRKVREPIKSAVLDAPVLPAIQTSTKSNKSFEKLPVEQSKSMASNLIAEDNAEQKAKPWNNQIDSSAQTKTSTANFVTDESVAAVPSPVSISSGPSSTSHGVIPNTQEKTSYSASSTSAINSMASPKPPNLSSLTKSPYRPLNRPSYVYPQSNKKNSTTPSEEREDKVSNSVKIRSKSTVAKQWNTISSSISNSSAKRLLLSPFSSEFRRSDKPRNSSTQKPDLPSQPKGEGSPVSHVRSEVTEQQIEIQAIMKRLVKTMPEEERIMKRYEESKKAGLIKESMTPSLAAKTQRLNIYERGEILDYRHVYFCGRPDIKKISGDIRHAVNNYGFDDANGDYQVVPGDHIAYRYEILGVLGKGSFGKVLKCVDHKSGKLVAVKLIINRKRFHMQALVEADILKTLSQWVSGSQVCGQLLIF